MRRQHRQILVALLEGPITTADSQRRAGVLAFSQRAGELERMGLVIRRHVEISEASSPVVEGSLTEEGRRVAQALRSGTYREEPAGQAGVAPRPSDQPKMVRPDTQPATRPSPSLVPAGSLFPEGPVPHDGRRARAN